MCLVYARLRYLIVHHTKDAINAVSELLIDGSNTDNQVFYVHKDASSAAFFEHCLSLPVAMRSDALQNAVIEVAVLVSELV